MSVPSTDPTPWNALGPDPGRAIRCWVALLLRLGIGLSLLGTGLSGYFQTQSGVGGMGGPLQSPSSAMLEPFLSALPYLSIGLGLALVLGFLTTPASIAAGFFSLQGTIFSIIEIVGAGRANPSGWQFYTPASANASNLAVMMTLSLPNLLPLAALIWLSPLENHPYSIDALIFRRNEMEIPEPAPAPEPSAEIPARTEPGDTIQIGD